jgi:hypothetical protein
MDRNNLAEAIGVSKAEMKWTHYWRDIVKLHLVIIEGWPEDIPFGNLSEVATSMPKLESLQRKWKQGTIHFRKLTEAEFQQLDEERDKQIENGEVEVVTRKSRSDKGKKRAQPDKENCPPGRCQGQYKSAELVEEEDDDDDEGI